MHQRHHRGRTFPDCRGVGKKTKNGMKQINLIDVVTPLYLAVDRRGVRQAVVFAAVLFGALVVTGNLTLSVFILMAAVAVYLLWTTVGRALLTAARAKKLLSTANGEADPIDLSTHPEWRKRERFLGYYAHGGFIAGNVDINKPFKGFASCLNKYSLKRRFRASLVEIDGKKLVRKSYTPCDNKFYLGLRNNLMVRHLGISPPIRYVSIPDRAVWTEFVEGPSLTTVSNTTSFSDLKQQWLISTLNGFDHALHQIGLCNLDLHRGNIIMSPPDGKPVFIDLDEQHFFPRKGFLFKLRCRIDRISLNEEINLIIACNRLSRATDATGWPPAKPRSAVTD